MFGLNQGFDTYAADFPADRWYLHAGEVNARVFPWLEAHRDGPFFLWVHYSDPHEPYAPPGAPDDLTVYVNDKLLGSYCLANYTVNTAELTLERRRHRDPVRGQERFRRVPLPCPVRQLRDRGRGRDGPEDQALLGMDLQSGRRDVFRQAVVLGHRRQRGQGADGADDVPGQAHPARRHDPPGGLPAGSRIHGRRDREAPGQARRARARRDDRRSWPPATTAKAWANTTTKRATATSGTSISCRTSTCGCRSS